MIRRGKLWRECKCGKMFEPTGSSSKLCDNCNPPGKLIRKLIKIQKKVNKK